MNIASKTVLMNLSGSTAGVTTLTGSVDCKGFAYAQIMVLANSTAAVHTTAANNLLQESDDDSSYSSVAAAASGTAFTVSTNTVVSTGPKVIYNIDLRGRKRYLKLTCGLAATATGVGIVAHLTKGSDGPSTTAEQGASYAANI